MRCVGCCNIFCVSVSFSVRLQIYLGDGGTDWRKVLHDGKAGNSPFAGYIFEGHQMRDSGGPVLTSQT